MAPVSPRFSHPPRNRQSATTRRVASEWQRPVAGSLRASAGSVADQYNPVQFHAEDIARRSASSRRKCVRDNPHRHRSVVPGRNDKSRHERPAIDRLVEADTASLQPGKQGKLSTVATALTPDSGRPKRSLGNATCRGVRLAVLVHAYFPDVLDEFLAGSPNIVEPFDLYVTTPHEELVTPIFRLGAATLRASRWRQRKPWPRHRPVSSPLARGAFDGYLAVFKLHTKKSRYSEQGDTWRRSLVDGLPAIR